MPSFAVGAIIRPNRIAPRVESTMEIGKIVTSLQGDRKTWSMLRKLLVRSMVAAGHGDIHRNLASGSNVTVTIHANQGDVTPVNRGILTRRRNSN